MPTETQNIPGVPSPDRWIRHVTLTTDGKGFPGTAVLRNGADCTNGTALAALVTTAGASRGRVRFKAAVAGTLEFLFVRPLNEQTPVPYAVGNPGSVAIVANTENTLDVSIYGEARGIIRFTPSATLAAAITFVDWMAI